MFTGIVAACVPLERVTFEGSGARLWIPAPAADWAVEAGESVAVCGACLTVASLEDPASGSPRPSGTPGARMVFELSAETLERTWFSSLEAGRLLNLERSLELGERLGGHLVSGHVDGLGRIAAVRDVGDGGRLFSFEVDAERGGGLERYLIEKGSVTVDGISLTVVEPCAERFDVAVIPLTLEATNLGRAQVGQAVNLEADMIGKWIEKLLPG